MAPFSVEVLLREISQDIALTADELLRAAIRLLTTTPAPLPELARQGVLLGLFFLILGLGVRYVLGVPGSLTVDSEHEWKWQDSARMAAALAGLTLYYTQIDTAYTVLGTVTAPLGGGDALVAAVQLPATIDAGVVTGMVFALVTGQLAITAALIAAIRIIVLMGILPIVVPALTVGAILRAPPISGVCRGILRHLRWLVYAGFSAALVVQIGSVVTTAVSGLNAEMLSLMVVLVTLNLSVFAMWVTVARGPELERRFMRGRLGPLPAPDGRQPQGDDETDDRDRDRAPEAGREAV